MQSNDQHFMVLPPKFMPWPFFVCNSAAMLTFGGIFVVVALLLRKYSDAPPSATAFIVIISTLFVVTLLSILLLFSARQFYAHREGAILSVDTRSGLVALPRYRREFPREHIVAVQLEKVKARSEPGELEYSQKRLSLVIESPDEPRAVFVLCINPWAKRGGLRIAAAIGEAIGCSMLQGAAAIPTSSPMDWCPVHSPKAP